MFTVCHVAQVDDHSANSQETMCEGLPNDKMCKYPAVDEFSVTPIRQFADGIIKIGKSIQGSRWRSN